MCIRDRARAVTAGGESGHADSPHFTDQAAAYSMGALRDLSLIHISEPTRLLSISYAVSGLWAASGGYQRSVAGGRCGRVEPSGLVACSQPFCPGSLRPCMLA